jgi:hypothetical protein
MSLIRLVYGIADKETTTISDTSQRYELYGSPQAMWNVWFQFTQLATLAARDTISQRILDFSRCIPLTAERSILERA